jgi:hypothetical protein
MSSSVRFAAVVGAVLIASGAAAARPATTVQFRVYAATGIRLADVVWTGSRFLYVENTTNAVYSAGPKGTPLRRFASMPKVVEETRCRIAPAGSGFVAGNLYCHSPTNRIYRITPDGKHVVLFAKLPAKGVSDGALAFDTVGRFGHGLLAVTGRSGSAKDAGGAAYRISPKGKVRLVGRYPDTGGADEAMVAPASFGSAGGSLLVTVDAGPAGAIVAIDPKGHARTLVSLPDGPNPIVTVAPGRRTNPPAGLYVTDTLSKNVFFAPAAQLPTVPGTVLVGSELKGQFWTIAPAGSSFTATELQTSLSGGKYNFEGAVWVS